MVERKAVIKNEAGIHCRPTAVITQEAAKVDAVIMILSPGGTCQLGSALDLMMLGLSQGTLVNIQVEGPDEEQVADQFRELFETEFDFPNAGLGG
ncbi:HPr family phosphocarrier protein [Tichowtungia aerotolerans]|uniref:HPr family phosphocarrier protein n=1 Tax=Tichowtungia aerotolerans TaxID=2697043 RepID=A0A6P1M660_9BACT|nr:HPr family phosphocarrier protein [Tichowtungia aerotolerans]QHI69512.1 HPr family phosphocarrier protein [Tichowtungia aerotolerans]